MRVLLASFGTHGDLRPFAALALALRRAGHRADLAGPPDHRAWIEALGLPYTRVGDPYDALMAEFQASPARAGAAMARQVPAQLDALAPLVEDADLVLSGSMEFATPTLCERAERPRRAVLLSPAFVPAPSQPMPFLPWRGLPAWCNRLSWWLSDKASAATLLPPLARARQRWGLPPVQSASGHVLGAEVLLPFPAALATVEAPDVPVRHLPPWLLDDEAPLPDDVEEHLATGAPPVLWTLGSMPGPDPALCVAACRQLGLRALVHGPTAVDGALCGSGPLPHARLLPRCAAVVHHGGAGTLLTATRARRPQVLLPMVADQHLHAALVARHGLGTAVARRGLTADRLARALERALGSRDEDLARGAAAVAGAGADAAVGVVVEVAGRG